MFIKVVRKPAPHLQTIDFGFRKELQAPEEHFTHGWKLASLHNPALRDWHQAVKEKVFGRDFIRLHLTERVLGDGSRVIEVVQRIRLSDDEGDRSLSFIVKLSPSGKVSEISGKGNYLTIENWEREEYLGEGAITFISKD
jgi:CO dehydrogenase/acetyl-CoA synthase delta subunit